MDGTAKRRVRGTHLPTTQSPPHCTKRYNPSIDGRCTNIALHWYLNSGICTYVIAEKLILVALRSHFSCVFVLFYFADKKVTSCLIRHKGCSAELSTSLKSP